MRRDGRLELEGTIVPSYLLNSLPGRLPLVGRLFSAEPGGGLLAATFTATGRSGRVKPSRRCRSSGSWAFVRLSRRKP